jgi:hypothetical protein
VKTKRKLGLEEANEEAEAKRNEEILADWEEFKKLAREDLGNPEQSNDAHPAFPDNGGAHFSFGSREELHVRRPSRNAAAHAHTTRNLAPTSSDEPSRSTGHVSFSSRLCPNASRLRNTVNERRPETPGPRPIPLNPRFSPDVPSEPATHPDYGNYGPRKPCRLAKIFEERLSGSVRKVWPQREKSDKGCEGGSSEEGASPVIDPDVRGEQERARSMAATMENHKVDRKDTANAYEIFTNAARGVAAVTSTSIAPQQAEGPPSTLPPRSKQPSQTPSHRTLPSQSSSTSHVASPSQQPPAAPTLRTLLTRIEANSLLTYSQQNTSLPSLRSISVNPAESLPTSLPARLGSRTYPLWAQCRTTLDAVAAEAAARTRAEIELRKSKSWGRGDDASLEVDGVVRNAVVGTKGKPKLVVCGANRGKSLRAVVGGDGDMVADNRTEVSQMVERQRSRNISPWLGGSGRDAWRCLPFTASLNDTIAMLAELEVGDDAEDDRSEAWFSCYEEMPAGERRDRTMRR